MSDSAYKANIARRRRLAYPGYLTLADLGLDGEYVSPIQIISNSLTGPVLLAKDWLDGPSISENVETLKKLGYLPGMKFNDVLDRALELASLKRSDVYITQIFHLAAKTRSEAIKLDARRKSFDDVTYNELIGRNVVALGVAAEQECLRRGIKCTGTCHPSSRTGTNEERAKEIAGAIIRAMTANERPTRGFCHIPRDCRPAS